MTPEQLTAIKQALSNLKAAFSGIESTALSVSVSFNLTGSGAYSFNFQKPSAISGQPNTLAYSGPAAELPAAE